MTEIYSNQLISYIFNELSASETSQLESVLATNEELKQEYIHLLDSLNMIESAPTPKAPDNAIQYILAATRTEELI